MDADTARLIQTLILLASNTIGVAALWRKLDRKVDRKEHDEDIDELHAALVFKQDRAA